MPKPANLIPSKQLNVALPLPLFTELTMLLYSELEQRVPHGAYSRYLTELLRAQFEEEELDLAPWLLDGTPHGLYVIRGASETIRALKGILK